MGGTTRWVSTLIAVEDEDAARGRDPAPLAGWLEAANIVVIEEIDVDDFWSVADKQRLLDGGHRLARRVRQQGRC